jgi:hypothetical protein
VCLCLHFGELFQFCLFFSFIWSKCFSHIWDFTKSGW